ncbi:MAG: hypothetical protein B7Z73_08650 [Planctomycetia bacterium 21-64-5]|nr:MAG: hypothetical protein B7Z73_08650 [Planctomycetia bacterium 21-64-5]
MTAVMWLFAVVDEFVPPLIALVAMLFINLVPAQIALAGFYSPAFILLMGVYAISAVMLSSGLVYRFMLWLLLKAPDRPFWHRCALTFFGMLLSIMVPSDSARLALMLPLYREMDNNIDAPAQSREATALMIATFMGATLFAPLLFEVVRIAAPQTYRLPHGVSRAGALAFYVSELEAALRANHQRLAAMVIEPLVQGAAGMVTHPPGYLRAARDLSRRYDVLLIADEVAVGFGRTGRMFACEHEGVAPDLLCLAKGLTGGYLPMAATLASDEIWRAFLGSYDDSKQFFHGHTYGGNPLAAAAASASLDVFDDEQVLARMPEKISRLSQHLTRLKRLEHLGDVRQCGLIAGIELVRERASQTPFDVRERRGWRVCQHARRRGVLLRPLGDVVVIMPPLSISLEELDRIADAVESGIVAETTSAR